MSKSLIAAPKYRIAFNLLNTQYFLDVTLLQEWSKSS